MSEETTPEDPEKSDDENCEVGPLSENGPLGGELPELLLIEPLCDEPLLAEPPLPDAEPPPALLEDQDHQEVQPLLDGHSLLRLLPLLASLPVLASLPELPGLHRLVPDDKPLDESLVGLLLVGRPERLGSGGSNDEGLSVEVPSLRGGTS